MHTNKNSDFYLLNKSSCLYILMFPKTFLNVLNVFGQLLFDVSGTR